ncbi:MAG: GNAT family N-acetyltransferase [Deltaproteobacteria bacterium]|nr:GNAT family N-acetyltransferase [Deltaproteobacteria bacterium]
MLPQHIFKTQFYIDFLAQTHPELDICTQRLEGLPSFIASIPIGDALSPKWPKIIKKLLPKPKALVIGTPFEPYEQSDLLDAKPPKCQVAKHLDWILLHNVDPYHPNIPLWEEAGFKALPSFPDMQLNIHWKSFHDYLKSLKASVRKSVRQNIRKFEQSGFCLETIHDPYEIRHELFKAYEVFWQRAKIPWFKHSPAYFSSLAQLGTQAQLTIARSPKGETAGFVINFKDLSKSHAGRIGVLPQYDNKHSIYFRLLYHSIESAIQANASSLSLGPTGYQLKSRLGAQPRPLSNLVLGTKAPWRLAFKNLSLFGHLALKHLNNWQNLKQEY